MFQTPYIFGLKVAVEMQVGGGGERERRRGGGGRRTVKFITPRCHGYELLF